MNRVQGNDIGSRGRHKLQQRESWTLPNGTIFHMKDVPQTVKPIFHQNVCILVTMFGFANRIHERAIEKSAGKPLTG